MPCKRPNFRFSSIWHIRMVDTIDDKFPYIIGYQSRSSPIVKNAPIKVVRREIICVKTGVILGSFKQCCKCSQTRLWSHAWSIFRKSMFSLDYTIMSYRFDLTNLYSVVWNYFTRNVIRPLMFLIVLAVMNSFFSNKLPFLLLFNLTKKLKWHAWHRVNCSINDIGSRLHT
jgi:hypothetical protein